MKKENQIKFTNNISLFRKEKKMSQQELANKVGITRQTITQLEKNRFNPSLLVAYNISKIFQVSIEDIFVFLDDE